MSMREYLGVLGRRKWIVFLVTVLTVAAVAAATRMMTPVYSASAVVRIARAADLTGSNPAAYADRVMTTYVRLLEGSTYLGQVIERLGLDTSTGSLARQITVETLPNTELLRITAQSSDPALARDVANTLAVLLVEEGQRIYSGPGMSAREILQEQLVSLEDSLEENRSRLQVLEAGPDAEANAEVIDDLRIRIRTQEQTYTMLLDEYDAARLREVLLANSISVAEPAEAPSSPSRPNVRLNLALAVFVGLAGGIGLGFLVDGLNSSIHSAEGLEAASHVPVLGSIPSFPVPRGARGQVVLLGDDEPLLNSGEVPSPASEAFRMLRSVLLTGSLGGPAGSTGRPRTVLITSAAPSEGKSTAVANLAKVLAQTGRQVIAVDSDLRRPQLHRVFGLGNDVGLSTLILDRHAHKDHALQETRVPGVRVLTSGPLPRYPAELLSSSTMQQLIDDLEARADIVLFDSAPLLAASDAIGLAPMVEGVILVVARAEATDQQVRRALEQLERVGARVLGTVLNRAKPEDGGYAFYYHYDHAPAAVGRGTRVRR